MQNIGLLALIILSSAFLKMLGIVGAIVLSFLAFIVMVTFPAMTNVMFELELLLNFIYSLFVYSLFISWIIIYYKIGFAIISGGVSDIKNRLLQVFYYGADCVKSKDEKYSDEEYAFYCQKKQGIFIYFFYMIFCRYKNVYKVSLLVASMIVAFKLSI